ncbi:MAG: hypothetical protein IT340_18580 [Chloroflexi bacterium]|nr:hypothetical protein [Chloroflexota bacterium]
MTPTCRSHVSHLIRGCCRAGRWLAGRVRALAQWCFPAAARVLVVVPGVDRRQRRRLVGVVRRGLRASERVHDGLPAVPCRVRVLPLVGAPPAFADLGHLLATVAVRPIAGRPRAVITLAATWRGRPVADAELIATLTAALDHLAWWEPGDANLWTLPAPAAPPAPPIDAAGRRTAVGSPSWSDLAARSPAGAALVNGLPPVPSPPSPADPLGLGGQ